MRNLGFYAVRLLEIYAVNKKNFCGYADTF